MSWLDELALLNRLYVLHTLEYDDRGKRRPILYRAAHSEMFVSYGDPNPTHRLTYVFDAGELGIGVFANSLVLGSDCLGEIHSSTSRCTTRTGNRSRCRTRSACTRRMPGSFGSTPTRGQGTSKCAARAASSSHRS